MGVIRVLQEKVVSQIAAGEVVERPASVVRELMDNSIDAGARKVHVLIERGGKRLVKVTDDGTGMDRDDLLLSVERHATSKISAVEDLFSIRSLGFRGEAVPSIGAVSRMEVTTRPHDHLIGHKLRVAGGRIKSMEEAGCPAGTAVEVRDLFFNMPVRRKFLKGDRTETDHIADAFLRIGLPHLQIHFRLDEEQRTLLNLPRSASQLNRLSPVFGREAVASMTEVSQEAGEFKFRMYLADPDFARARTDRILFYVNGRYVRDRLLLHAVMEGYGQRLMRGRYPQAVVFIDVNPSLVDVNVHPTKQEIRLQQAHLIHEALVAFVRSTLGPKAYPVQETAGTISAGTTMHVQPEPSASEPPGKYLVEANVASAPGAFQVRKPMLFEDDLRILGQLRDTYILCETGEGLLLVDQHAAHERVLYETLKSAHSSSRMESQVFLIPQRLEVSVKDARAIMGRLEELHHLGMEIEPFGGSTFLLRSVPSPLHRVRWERMFADLMPLLEEGGDLSTQTVLDGFLTIMACHGAIRAGQHLSREEMEQLMKQLFGTGLPTNCPHGRPTLRKLSFEELERMFKRVV
jgi:DNA mismatch repair protein MutL